MGRPLPAAAPRSFHATALTVLISVLVLALPALISNEVYRTYNLPRYALLVTLAPLAALLLADQALAGRLPRVEGLLPMLGLEVGGLLLASLLRSPDLRHSFLGSFERQMGLLAYLAIAVVALGARAAVDGSVSRFRWLLRAVAVSGVIAFCKGPCNEGGDAWRWTGAYGHANYSANILLIPLFSAIGLAASSARDLARVAWAVAGALVAVELWLLQTRGAWLGAAAGAALLGSLLFFGPLRLEGVARRRLKLLAFGLAAASAAVLLAVLLWPRLREAALNRTLATLRVEGGSSGRFEGWRDAFSFFRGQGFLGVGAECFRDAFLPYKSEELGRVLGSQQLRDLHAMPLHLLAEGGVLSFFGYLGLAGLASLRLARAIRDRALGRGERWMAAGLLAAIAAHFIHNLTICHLIAASTSWHIAAAMGIAAGAGWGREQAPPGIYVPRLRAPVQVRVASAVLFAGLSVVGAVHAGRLLASDAALVELIGSEARVKKGGGAEDIDACLAAGDRAVRLSPHSGPPHNIFAGVLEGFVREVPGPAVAARRDALLNLAIRESKLAIRFGGNKESYPLQLSSLYRQAGRLDLAETEARVSVDADPHFYGSHLFLGRILLEEGRRKEALEELEKARRLAPGDPEVVELEKEIAGKS